VGRKGRVRFFHSAMRTDIHEDVHGTALPLSSRPRSFPRRNGPVPVPGKRMKIYRPLHQVSCLDPQALMRPVGEGNVLVERDTATLVEVCRSKSPSEQVGAGWVALWVSLCLRTLLLLSQAARLAWYATWQSWGV
jgi:hypothetical protein